MRKDVNARINSLSVCVFWVSRREFARSPFFLHKHDNLSVPKTQKSNACHLYVDVDVSGKCLGVRVVRNTAGSGEAGSGPRIPGFCIQLLYAAFVFRHFAQRRILSPQTFRRAETWIYLHKLLVMVILKGDDPCENVDFAEGTCVCRGPNILKISNLFRKWIGISYRK